MIKYYIEFNAFGKSDPWSISHSHWLSTRKLGFIYKWGSVNIRYIDIIICDTQ
jgi:hypothetical protein